MYFIVKKSTKILGKVYTPCVCYSVPEVLLPTVEKMVKEGRAYAYDEKVSFQNGKVLPSVKEREAKAKAEKKAEKQAKKEVKAKTVEVTNTEELAKEAGIAEGF